MFKEEADNLQNLILFYFNFSYFARNCESGVGKQVLQQAIDILDKFEEEDIKVSFNNFNILNFPLADAMTSFW